MPVRNSLRSEADMLAALAERIDSLTEPEIAVLRERLAPRLNRHSMMLLESLLAERRAAGWRADPLTMAQHLRNVEDWRHSKLLARKFRAAVTGEGARFQVWNQPAQTGKTTGLRDGCVWALDRDPRLGIIFLSYGDLLARESAIFVRDTAVEHEDELRFTLRPDLRRQNRWMTTEGGGMLATGIGGSVSGFPAGGVIVDDPLKNWQEAHSATTRDEVWNEIVAVARLRLKEGGWFILAHTRWHLDDPSGRMRKLVIELGVDVEFVSLPMLATSPDDPLGRALGEPLEPRRYSLAECQSRAKFLGSYLTAALEQQEPEPEEGGEIKRAWWVWETATPEPAHADEWISSWDMKLKDKATGDYVVGQVWARVGGHYWCTDQLRGQFTFLQTKIALALMQHRHPHVGTHIVENTGNGPEVMQELGEADPSFVLDDAAADVVGVAAHERTAVEELIRRGMPGLVPQNVKHDKRTRVRTIAGAIESRHVHLPEGKAWAVALVAEAASFPQGAHDDMVDAMSQALHRLRNVEAEAVTPVGTLVAPTPGARAVASIGALVPKRR